MIQARCLPCAGCAGVFGVQRQTHVHLHAANGRQVIALAVEEQGVEQGRGRFDGGRLARTHHAIDVHERGFAVHVLVLRHGVAHVGADIDVVDVQNRNVGDARVDQLFDGAADQIAVLVVFQGQLVTGFDIDRAVFFVDDVLGDELADDVIERHQQVGDRAFVDQLLHRARGDLLAGFGNDFTGGRVDQVIGRAGAAYPLGEERGDPPLLLLQLVGIHVL